MYFRIIRLYLPINSCLVVRTFLNDSVRGKEMYNTLTEFGAHELAAITKLCTGKYFCLLYRNVTIALNAMLIFVFQSSSRQSSGLCTLPKIVAMSS
jgi:hypothetical protein